MDSPLRIFVSAGEASGDLYGALLIQALRERLGAAEFFGSGGDRMRAAGCRTLVDARQVAMVGIVEVLPGLPRAWLALRRLRSALRSHPPTLAILIDFPDFNLRLARELKRAGSPVLYFVAPQVWAWRRGRLAALRAHVDRLLCIFPFEELFFQAEGVAAEFVGHPLVGRVAPTLPSREFRTRFRLPEKAPLIALLPGSRRREILLNLPPLIETARKLAAEGDAGLLFAAGSTAAADWIRTSVAKAGCAFPVIENHTYDAVAHAAAAIVASGTATIETALLGTPLVVVYRVSRATWWLGHRLVRTPFYSMVNLVAGRQVVPELIQAQFQPETVAREVRQLLESSQRREQMRQDLREVAEKLRPPVRSRLERSTDSPGDEPATLPSASLGTSLEAREGDQNADAIQRAVAVAASFLSGGYVSEAATAPDGNSPRLPSTALPSTSLRAGGTGRSGQASFCEEPGQSVQPVAPAERRGDP